MNILAFFDDFLDRLKPFFSQTNVVEVETETFFECFFFVFLYGDTFEISMAQSRYRQDRKCLFQSFLIKSLYMKNKGHFVAESLLLCFLNKQRPSVLLLLVLIRDKL